MVESIAGYAEGNYYRTIIVGKWSIMLSVDQIWSANAGNWAGVVVASFYYTEAKSPCLHMRVVKGFRHLTNAIEWLARLPEDDPPDFSTMGLEVE